MFVKLLYFIPSLDYSGAAKQLLLLATGLPRERFTLRVCAWDKAAPWAEALRSAGIEVETLSWRRLVDLRPLVALRRSIGDFRPEVVHVWGTSLLWPGLHLRSWAGGRLVVSGWPPARKRSHRLGWLDRWTLRSAPYQVVATGPGEAEHCCQLGMPGKKIVLIAPAVGPALEPSAKVMNWRAGLGLPSEARLLVCVGPLQMTKGYRDAIWAFDMLKYLYPNLRLLMIGDGPDRARLEEFARALHARDEIIFTGRWPQVGELMQAAEMVWVPGRVGGLNVALEAMAAGRPVVAARQPALAEVIRDGETGFLFPPGDKAALARQTRALLEAPDRRRQIGDAGRQRAAAFSVTEMVRRHLQLYEGH